MRLFRGFNSSSLPIFNKKPSFYIEDASIQSQYLIYSSAEYILQSTKRMKRFCQANHLGKGLLAHSMKYIPFWFTHIIADNDNSSYSVSIEEVKSLISYLSCNNIPVNFKTLSMYLHSTIDPRKRPDILKIIHFSENSLTMKNTT